MVRANSRSIRTRRPQLESLLLRGVLRSRVDDEVGEVTRLVVVLELPHDFLYCVEQKLHGRQPLLAIDHRVHTDARYRRLARLEDHCAEEVGW